MFLAPYLGAEREREGEKNNA